jgi:hypothetical protein
MNGQDVIDAFQLQNEQVFKQKVESVTTIEVNTFVIDRQWNLPLKG